jgi:hypothetical protein
LTLQPSRTTRRGGLTLEHEDFILRADEEISIESGTSPSIRAGGRTKIEVDKNTVSVSVSKALPPGYDRHLINVLMKRGSSLSVASTTQPVTKAIQ